MSYNGGEISELPDIDTDTLDVFFIRDYHKKIGYDKISQTRWLVPNRPLQTGLRAIADDKELMEMCYLAQQNKGVIHVYYEHGVSEPVYIEKAEPVTSKGKELMLIPTIFPTPKSTTNLIPTTTEPIPTTIAPIPITTPCTPTSELKKPVDISKPKELAASVSADNHDSDDSADDEPYRPGADEVSNEEELPLDRSAAKTNVKLSSRTPKKLTKRNKAVMVEDDGPVCAYSDSDDDEIIFGPIPKFGSSVAPYHDVQDDAYNDSDGGDS
ncbi:hypothetical protein Ahy_A01g004218 [Arachis hypogaea]|uniref:PB1-like domain-containing protein n=1 Tax=Arachis hypogaea TaxID=3818 RepID=A0A445EV70_ARAHY|nr:hypothetical protein Ahy_A01g004218 [Arachis hypogaea]